MTAPAPECKKINYFAAGERERLLIDLDKTLDDRPNPHAESYAIALGVKIALLTGMRESEICGMRWIDLNFEAATYVVRTVIGRTNSTYYIKQSKSNKSRRTIPLHPTLVADLKKQKERMRKKVDKASIPWSESMFVLGEPVWSENDNDWFYLKPRLLCADGGAGGSVLD